MVTSSSQSDVNQSASLDNRNITAAATPFNDTKADLIIHSSDNIHCYVHKLLLSIVSLFEGMFTLPYRR